MTGEAILSDVLLSDGVSLLAFVVATQRLGHSDPISALEYAHCDTPAVDLVRWCSQRRGWEAARDRLMVHCEDTGAFRWVPKSRLERRLLTALEAAS